MTGGEPWSISALEHVVVHAVVYTKANFAARVKVIYGSKGGKMGYPLLARKYSRQTLT
jgi:hypothetical protein